MRGKKNLLPCSIREAKCLAAVKECALSGKDPSALAVALLLRGDDQVAACANFKTFGCLSSLSIRKAKTMMTLLQKKRMLSSYAPPPYLERYLILTDEGEAIAAKILSKNIRKNEKKPAKTLFNERK